MTEDAPGHPDITRHAIVARGKGSKLTTLYMHLTDLAPDPNSLQHSERGALV